jgi:hypothetical protein
MFISSHQATATKYPAAHCGRASRGDGPDDVYDEFSNNRPNDGPDAVYDEFDNSRGRDNSYNSYDSWSGSGSDGGGCYI